MEFKAFLIKYAEIGIKGNNRRFFEDALVRQMKYALKPVGEFAIRKESGRIFVHALEEREIYVSAGSACSSNKPEVSGTLKGIGLTKEYYESTLRFSFSIFNTVEEADICVEALKELLPMLRRFTRR